MITQFLDVRYMGLPAPHFSDAAMRRVVIGAYRRNPKLVLASGLLVLVSLALLQFATTLSTEGAFALIVLLAAVVLWTMTSVDDTKVAIGAVLALAVTGVADKQQIYAALGHELIWLLIASFVIAAVLRASGLLERGVMAFAAHATSYRQLFYSLTIAIAATAFVIPSTSARAAVLVPVFLAFATKIADPAIRRALALLFPTAILLSAGGSLIGAGAHVIAVDTIARASGHQLDYFGWFLIAGPFAFTSTLAATWLILRLFTTSAQTSAVIAFEAPTTAPLSLQQKYIIAVVAAMVGLWITAPMHGIGMGLVAIAAMVTLLAKQISPIKSKDAFKAVEVELIVFVAMAFILADALKGSGADAWLAQGLLDLAPAGMTTNRFPVVLLLAVVSLLAHLIVTSRTARASVLIPSMTIPLIGLGHDPTLLVMIIVLGTGFCQTLTVSAKPVAIFANLDVPTYAASDLSRLALALFPVMLITLVATGLIMWG